MNRIEKLLQELCPDGVRFLEIETLFDLRNGYTPSKTNAAFWSDGTIPWFRMEDIREHGGVLYRSIQQISEAAVKGGKLFPANSLLFATSATIGTHALVTVPHLSNQRFTSLAVKAEYAQEVDMKFMYYYGFVLNEWCSRNTTTSSFASVDMAGFRKFRVPVPPIEIQREIVVILDRFTQLEAELEAELEARKRQAEYYQSQVFMNILENQAAQVSLSAIGRWYGGGTPSKARSDFWKGGTIPWISPKDMTCTTVHDTRDHITRSAVECSSTKMVPAQAIALVVRSSILDHTLPVAYVPMQSTLNQDMKSVVPFDGYDPRYIFHAFRANRTSILRYARRSGGSVASLDSRKLWQYKIPIPEIGEQRRIAALLDRFDALINDINIGLPAELAARRKQYEYYRDRLLTFKELDA